MDFVVPAGEAEEATMSTYCLKGLLIDDTYAEPQAATHLQRGSATNYGIAAATIEAYKMRALRSSRTKFTALGVENLDVSDRRRGIVEAGGNQRSSGGGRWRGNRETGTHGAYQVGEIDHSAGSHL